MSDHRTFKVIMSGSTSWGEFKAGETVTLKDGVPTAVLEEFTHMFEEQTSTGKKSATTDIPPATKG